MSIEIPVIRWQILVAAMFLLVSFVAADGWQVASLMIVGCTFFIWALIDGAIDVMYLLLASDVVEQEEFEE